MPFSSFASPAAVGVGLLMAVVIDYPPPLRHMNDATRRPAARGLIMPGGAIMLSMGGSGSQLFAGHCHGRRRIDRGRNLRGDHERKNNGRHAHQSQELINRKHRYRPPKMTRFFLQIRSVRPLSGTLIASENLVGIGSPGDREQRQDRDDGQNFHGHKVVLDCGRKRQPLVYFQDDPEKDDDRPGSSCHIEGRRQPSQTKSPVPGNKACA